MKELITKRAISALLLFAMVFSAFTFPGRGLSVDAASTVPNIMEYESNTSSSSFIITSYFGMLKFSSLASTTTFKGKTVYLGGDIDMSLGTYTPFASFAGTFDGKGFALKGIQIDAVGGSAGVFAKVSSTGIVKNLGVEGGSMRLASSLDSDRLGSIAGVLSGGTIERCYSTADLVITKGGTVTDLSVGGIAGGTLSGGLIKNCYFAGTATGVEHASGISDWCQGQNEGAVGQIVNCYSIGTLKATETFGLGRYSGSILESNYGAAVVNSYYTGSHTDLSFTTADVKIAGRQLTDGTLAYNLDNGSTSNRTRVWHQGELFPELSGDTAMGTYKLSITVVANGVSSSVTNYMNAGAVYPLSGINATLSSTGNVTNNVFTMPAAAASLKITTSVPNVLDYASNSTATSFVISTAAGFTKMAEVVNAGTDTFSGDSIYVLADINMNSITHTPIGVYISDSDYSTSFQGKLYGLEHRVHGIKVNSTALNGAGLFGCSYKAEFYDFGVTNGTVTSANRAGGISGYADACKFVRCYNGATVKSLTGEDGTAGIAGVGRSGTTFTNCFNIGAVHADADCVGGITGWGQKTAVLVGCYNAGLLTSTGVNIQGLTRFNGSLSKVPVGSYYLKDSSKSTYGVEKDNTAFACGEVAWLLNTKGGTANNSGVFTATPLYPAILTFRSLSSSAIKVDADCVNGDGDLITKSVIFCNSGDKVLPENSTTAAYAAEALSATADSTLKFVMNTTAMKTMEIGTAAQLAALATAVNGGTSYADTYIRLTANIDMSSRTCVPIGKESAPFSGIFDGQGFTVSGYNMSNNTAGNAMFGCLLGGTVKNLFLGASKIEGGSYTGALVGKNHGGTVINCGTDSFAGGYWKDNYTISVMSFNIRVPNDASPNALADRTPRVKQHLTTYAPDIVGFQEVTPAWQTVLNSHLSGYSKEFVWRDSGKSEAAPLYWNTSVFTSLEQGTFWLSETPDVMSIGWDASLNRTCSYAVLKHKASGILVIAMNTHFDHKSSTARTNSGKLVTKRAIELEKKYRDLGYGDNIAIYCTGDYNCGTTTAAYKNMNGYLTDLRTDAATMQSSASQTTFHGWGDSSSLIDFIFTNNRGSESLTYKVNNEKVNGGYISDHYTLYGTFALNHMYVGGIVGYNGGTVADCYTVGTINGGMNTGGIVGYNAGVVKNSYCGVEVTSTKYMGGIAGLNLGVVSGCYYVTSAEYTAFAANFLTTGSMAAADMKTAAFATKLSASGTKWRQKSTVNSAYPYPLPLFGVDYLIIAEGSTYTRDADSYLLGVELGTAVSTLIANFDNDGVEVYSADGILMSTTSTVGTGCTVRLVFNGEVCDSVTVVVIGDLDSTGGISTTDYAITRMALKGGATLDGAYSKAADMNGDGDVSSADGIAMKTVMKKG